MLHFHWKDRSSLIFEMVPSVKYYLIFFNQHRNTNCLHPKKSKKVALSHFCTGPDPLLFHVCSPFSPWPRFISIIHNTYIFYTSYAYLFVIRSDRISRHPRNPLSVCLTHISDSTPYLLISFNSGKLWCIQVIQGSSGKFRYVQVNWGKFR